MRVAVIVGDFPVLSESFILNHIIGLVEAGHEVEVFAARTGSGKRNPDFERYQVNEITSYMHLPRLLDRFLHLPQQLVKLRIGAALECLNVFRYGPGVASLKYLYGSKSLQRHHFDIVHCHFGTNGLAFLCLKDLFEAAYVTSFHGSDIRIFGRWGTLMYGSLFRSADAIVTNTRYLGAQLKRIGCPEHKMVEIPALMRYKGIISREGDVLNTSPVRILTVARLHPLKGIQHCLQAVKILTDQKYKVTYAIVGDGAYRNHLQEMASNLGMNHIVEFKGWLNNDEVYEEYRMSDIFVLPSIPNKRNNGLAEAQGLVVQEAQMHGISVVASRVGGIPEGISHEKSGLLCEPENPADLAAKIQRLIDNPTFAREMAKAGEEECRQNYLPETIIGRYERLYELLRSRNRNKRIKQVGAYHWPASG